MWIKVDMQEGKKNRCFIADVLYGRPVNLIFFNTNIIPSAVIETVNFYNLTKGC